MKIKLTNPKIKKTSFSFFMFFFFILFIVFLFAMYRLFNWLTNAEYREYFIGNNGPDITVATNNSHNITFVANNGPDITVANKWCDNVGSYETCTNSAKGINSPLLPPADEPIEDGICLTENEEWGIRLKEYGRKCIPMSMIKNANNNISLMNILTQDSTSTQQQKQTIPSSISTSQPSTPPPKMKRIFYGVDLETIPPPKGQNDTLCLPDNTDFEAECKKEFGPQFGVKEINKNPNSANNCYTAQCSIDYFNKNKITTDTSRTCYNNNSNFEQICATLTNNPMKNKTHLFVGADGGCYIENGDTYTANQTQTRILCYEERPDNSTDCLNWNNNQFDNECNNMYNKPYSGANVLSNCRFGKRRGICGNVQ
jgi:hypothetical protein